LAFKCIFILTTKKSLKAFPGQSAVLPSRGRS
jgi:hypothetical protein